MNLMMSSFTAKSPSNESALGILGDLISSPREDLSVQEHDRFRYILVNNVSLRRRAEALRRLNLVLFEGGGLDTDGEIARMTVAERTKQGLAKMVGRKGGAEGEQGGSGTKGAESIGVGKVWEQKDSNKKSTQSPNDLAGQIGPEVLEGQSARETSIEVSVEMQGGLNKDGHDWSLRSASVLGSSGCMHFVVASMCMRRHSTAFSSHGVVGDLSQCNAWPEGGVKGLLQRALAHLDKQLTEKGLPEGSLADLLLLLTSSHAGIDEYRLARSLGLSAYNFSVLMREAHPYMMCCGGCFHLSNDVKNAVKSIFTGRQLKPVYNGLKAAPKESFILPLRVSVFLSV